KCGGDLRVERACLGQSKQPLRAALARRRCRRRRAHLQSRLSRVHRPDARRWPARALINHLKSKGFGSNTGVRRRRQAERVAEIYEGLLSDGETHIAVVGDM